MQKRFFLFYIFSLVLFYGYGHSDSHAANVKFPINDTNVTYKKDENITYNFSWFGIRIGRTRLSFAENETSYNAVMTLKTTGVARMINKQKRSIKTTGSKQKFEDYTLYTPTKILSEVVRPKKKSSSILEYDADGKVTKAELTPPSNSKTRPDVPKEQKDSSLDYFTAWLSLIMKIENLHDKTEISELVYDAKRLTKLILTPAKISSEEQEKYKFSSNTKKFIARRKLIAGYTKKEKTKFAKGDPPILIFVDLTKSRFPLVIYANTKIGRVTAKVKN